MGQQRRQFSPEFKRDTVELVRSFSRPMGEVARELGCGETSLENWLSKDGAARAKADLAKENSSSLLGPD